MRIEKHTIQWRLWTWGQWVYEMRSKMLMIGGVAKQIGDSGQVAQIAPVGWARDRNAAGSHSDGIKYQIIDGVPVPPDGGMGELIERRAASIAHHLRCKETNEAVSWLPQGMRRIVVDTYVVPGRGKPRSTRLVAERLMLNQKTVQESLQTAHEKLARRIYGPFEIVEETEAEKAA